MDQIHTISLTMSIKSKNNKWIMIYTNWALTDHFILCLIIVFLEKVNKLVQ